MSVVAGVASETVLGSLMEIGLGTLVISSFIVSVVAFFVSLFSGVSGSMVVEAGVGAGVTGAIGTV